MTANMTTSSRSSGSSLNPAPSSPPSHKSESTKSDDNTVTTEGTSGDAEESAKTTAAPIRAERESEKSKTSRSAALKATEPVSKQASAKVARGETKPAFAPEATTATSLVEGVSVTGAATPVGPNAADAAPARPSAPVAPPRSAAAPKAAKPETNGKIERPEQSSEQKTMKTNTNRHGFKLNEYVVYPAHGVGQIVSVEEQEVAGFKLELFVINFVKDKMTLRVPTAKVTGVGMRKLSDPDAAKRSLEILSGRARIKRTMWSRRAQEYEAKINSGDINAIAEVVRDLYRSDAQPEQSYSERQLYEAALDRMMREIAAVHKVSETEAHKLIEVHLKKNAKRAGKGEGGETEGEETDIEEAA